MLRACDEWLQARDGKDSHQKNLNYTASEGSRREERTLRCISLEFLTRPFMNILVAKCVTLSRLSEDISIQGCTQMSGQMPAGIHSSTRVAGLFFVSPTHDAAATWRPTAGPEVWCRVELLPQTVSFEQESCKRRWGIKVLMLMEFQELTRGCKMYLPGGCQEVCRC